jgi:hypothetical protein
MKRMAKFFLLVLLFLWLALPTRAIAQESSYVLPYPSYMPGNPFYLPKIFINKLSSVLYFGDFGKLEYSLKQSDHYLVEAKTLFEYKQYLLGSRALEKSNYYFDKIPDNLRSAERNGKDISEKEALIAEAARKHREVLTRLKAELPEEFVWTPEKSEPTKIDFRTLLNQSLNIRTEL